MPPAHDTAVTFRSIFAEVQNNLNDSGLHWFSEDDILTSLQEAYNKLVAMLAPIEHSTLIPQLSTPYYNLAAQISDYMYLSAVYNPYTNLWLEGMSYKLMKATYQTYLAIGQPKWFNIVDLRRTLFWPFQPSATGVLYVIYKASAPPVSYDSVPLLPHSCGALMLEYFATADLCEQARQFKKAKIWWAKLFSPPSPKEVSLYIQAQKEIKNLARADREMVLEPFRWIFHGGSFNLANWINNETPVGTINGSNGIFTVAQVPNPTSSFLLVKNGLTQKQGTHYTLSGQTISYLTDYIPQSGDEHHVWYQVA